MDDYTFELVMSHLNGMRTKINTIGDIKQVQNEINKKRKREDEYEETKDSNHLEETRQEIKILTEKELKLKDDLKNTDRENNLLLSLVSIENKLGLVVPETQLTLRRMASGCGCYTGTCPGPLMCTN